MVSAVQKSSSMLEFLAWEPSAPKKTPISLLAVPIEVGFGGTHAEQRGSFYMADIVGRFMAESSGLVKALVCDSAGTHKIIRRSLHGQLSSEGGGQHCRCPVVWKACSHRSTRKLPSKISNEDCP